MGNDNKETVGKVTPRREAVYDFAEKERNRTFGGNSDTMNEFIPQSQEYYNALVRSRQRQEADYGNIMGGMRDWRTSQVNPLMGQIDSRRPTQFSFERINPKRSAETQEALGGYREFSQTGGYSPTDIQELRARGTSPIRAAYGNTMRELDRARSLGGGGGAPNYIAAAADVQRNLPQQLADATTNVNAGLAEQVRSGRLAGLGGMTGISEGEAGRGMQAAMANQGANLRVQELTEQGYSAQVARQIAVRELGLRGLEGERSLFGTTPAMASTFGNQALQSYQQRTALDSLRNQFGLGLIDAQMRALGNQAPEGKPWWQTALDVGTSFIPFLGTLGVAIGQTLVVSAQMIGCIINA